MSRLWKAALILPVLVLLGCGTAGTVTDEKEAEKIMKPAPGHHGTD